VSNSDGVLIARLDSGREMAFEPQECSAAATTKRQVGRLGVHAAVLNGACDGVDAFCEQAFDPFVEEDVRTVGELVDDARHDGRQ